MALFLVGIAAVGQRVVFPQNSHGGAAVAPLRDEGGGQVAHAALHLESVLFEHVFEQFRGLEFLESDFREVPDFAGDFARLARLAVEVIDGMSLEIVHVFLHMVMRIPMIG